jgi:predicted small lipoprotein YifL
MKHTKLSLLAISVVMALLLLAGCGSPAPTPVPPTPTLAEEKYEAISIADYEPNMELSGRIQWDANGLVNGGPVDSFSFWGQKIELTSNMITDGFLSTKDYGKIMIKANSNGSMRIELTPNQQKKIKQLKK